MQRSAGLDPLVVASHGPVLEGPFVAEGFQLLRQSARLAPVARAHQGALDLLVATVAASGAPVSTPV